MKIDKRKKEYKMGYKLGFNEGLNSLRSAIEKDKYVIFYDTNPDCRYFATSFEHEGLHIPVIHAVGENIGLRLAIYGSVRSSKIHSKEHISALKESMREEYKNGYIKKLMFN